jgi:hypothetical protein
MVRVGTRPTQDHRLVWVRAVLADDEETTSPLS